VLLERVLKVALLMGAESEDEAALIEKAIRAYKEEHGVFWFDSP
jgi:hypothetical protein